MKVVNSNIADYREPYNALNSKLTIGYSLETFSEPLNTPQLCYDYLMQIWDQGLINIQEQTYIVCMNNRLEAIGWYPLCSGTDVKTFVYTKLALGIALGCQATKMILAHNHPSRIKRPSADDINATMELHETAKRMDIELYDHLIVTSRGYWSFRENELLD